jgi:2-keto-4-pentenoate hydratase/2-oxohepta-3-ene-1,7-dioic acid hydratase in catechol pathway
MSERASQKIFGRFFVSGRTFVGEVEGDEVRESKATSMLELIDKRLGTTDSSHDLSELKVLAPVERPSKIICVGLNYKGHIREMGSQLPQSPIIFSKPSSAMVGPGDSIVLPSPSRRVDYEGESAIVIGKRASHVRNGSKYIFGYTCFNDVTARDLQESDVDWTRAKGFDTFAPTGPFISTTAPSKVTTKLNGKVVQHSLLSDRVFDDANLVEYISTIMTLEPGDVIPTGTPSGISPMSPGDVVEVELDTVGTLRNKVIKSG